MDRQKQRARALVIGMGAIAALVLAASGCAGAGDYLARRGRDLADPFTLTLKKTLPLTVGAHVQATDAAWVTVLSDTSDREIGLQRGRVVYGVTDEALSAFTGLPAVQFEWLVARLAGWRTPGEPHGGVVLCTTSMEQQGDHIAVPDETTRAAVLRRLEGGLFGTFVRPFPMLMWRTNEPREIRAWVTVDPDVSRPVEVRGRRYVLLTRFFGRRLRAERALPSAESSWAAWRPWPAPRPLRPRPAVRWLDVEVSVSALLLGARLGVSPGEVLDLLAGVVGLDPAGDG
jgi:hypothetical protein